jgi:hypothetical protein
MEYRGSNLVHRLVWRSPKGQPIAVNAFGRQFEPEPKRCSLVMRGFHDCDDIARCPVDDFVNDRGLWFLGMKVMQHLPP